jgi:endonuclease YncB( thermonuclease family)
MKNIASVVLAALVLLLGGAAAQAAAERTAVGRVSVVDGDTLELHGLRIRLGAIDAPEARQTCRLAGVVWPCGRQAAFALADLVGARPVSCQWRRLDRYGRPVARCHVGGTDLAAWMVEHGWALAFRRYGVDYIPHERRARAARLGIWSGEFVPPWAWRAGNGGEVSAESYLGS